MYESCSNRNLFEIVTRRTWNLGVWYLSFLWYSARTRPGLRGTLTSVVRLRRYTIESPSLWGMYSNSGVATDATKIIAFRCPEGGTTAFDKTFSAISALPRLFPSFQAAHTVTPCGSRYSILPGLCPRVRISVCFYCSRNTSQTGTKMASCKLGENSECGFLLPLLRIAMHPSPLADTG